jgi:hypothetical protein
MQGYPNSSEDYWCDKEDVTPIFKAGSGNIKALTKLNWRREKLVLSSEEGLTA